MAMILAALTIALAVPSDQPLQASAKPASGSDIRTLSAAAKAGDPRAQLEPGRRYAAGDGVAVDLKRAEVLLRRAATDRGGTSLRYQQSDGSGAPAGTAPVSAGPAIAGLAEARQAWVDVRARIAAEAAPSGQELEAGIIERSRISASRPTTLRVVGPTVRSGRFRYTGDRRDGQVCDAIRALLKENRDYGMRDCVVRIYTGSTGQSPLFMLRYQDDYETSEEYQDIVAEVDYLYRPPFTPIVGLLAAGPLCGRYVVYHLDLSPTDRVPLVIRPAGGRGADLTSCPQGEDTL